MIMTLAGRVLAGALAVLASQTLHGAATARDFASMQPTARVEYWQQRQAAIDAQVADAASLRAVPQNLALNIGISGDRTEHLLFRILPKAQGGLGQLDAPELAPEFFVLMIGINNSYAPEMPVADSVFEGVLAVMRSLHARKPGTRIMLQSILPTAELSRDDAVVRPVNLRLAALARSTEFAGFTTWLDLYPAFVDAQGKQDARLFVDGLHPSEAGYRVWRDRLVPALASARASVGHSE
jgi:lysophospholipase L1-like esterase